MNVEVAVAHDAYTRVRVLCDCCRWWLASALTLTACLETHDDRCLPPEARDLSALIFFELEAAVLRYPFTKPSAKSVSMWTRSQWFSRA